MLLVGSGAWAASVSGVVVANATGQPLARTNVHLQTRNNESPAGQISVLTGSGGEFSFDGLSAGIYFLRAVRKGYETFRHGQTEPDGPGTPIVLGAGSHFAVNARLRRLGVVTGAVLDENQVGIEGVSVHAYRMVKAWKAVASARTDDRGVYRLSGLKPGRYLIRSAAAQLSEDLALLPTYFGQAVSVREARGVEVRLDQEVERADITPGPGRLGRLSGRLTGASASEVQLLTEVGPRRAPVRPGGVFDFGQLEPGTYTVLVDREAAGGNLAALEPVLMGESDVRVGVEMKLAPRLRINCEAAAAGRINRRGVSVFLRRKDSQDGATRVKCGMDSPWNPGDWEVGVATPPGHFAAAILGASPSESAYELQLLPGSEQELSILLSDRPGRISGVVRVDGDAAVGAPVYLNAYDRELRSRAGGVRSTRTDGNGIYRFAGLPPGGYEVISSYQIRDAEGEGWPQGAGASVRVEEGEEVERHLRLTSFR